MRSVYDRTDIYDLFDSEDRYQAIKRHWQKVLNGRDVRTLLDVSIGTGGLTLPLAELGVQLYGSDLSESMLEKCRSNAGQRGLSVDLRACDFRALQSRFDRQFDCVASTGNSLPHVTNEDVAVALRQMDALVRDGGYLYFDLRNWDRVLRERERFYLYNPMFDGDTRINLTQVWDYHDDGSMTFNLLYAFEREHRIFQKEVFEEHYYPIGRRALLDELTALGYRQIEVMCHPAYFENVDLERVQWYCVLAQK